MTRPALARSEVDEPADSGAPSHLRIRFGAGLWHLTEDGAGRIGGVFRSLSSAVDYARSELRGVRGARVVLELDTQRKLRSAEVSRTLA